MGSSGDSTSKSSWIYGLLLVLLTMSVCYELLAGSIDLTLTEVSGALFWKIGAPWAERPEALVSLTVFDLRLPRLLAALSIGATMSATGAVVQGYFRNPLAEPSLLGITAGAMIGAAVYIVLLVPGGMVVNAVSGSPWAALSLPACSSLGALVATSAVIVLARRDRANAVVYMLLAGIALSSLSVACIRLLTFLANDIALRNLTVWMIGTLAGLTWPMLYVMVPVHLLSLGICLVVHRELDVLTLGEESAFHLGVKLSRLRLLVVLSACLGVGTAVAFAGPIGFLGLVVPHMCRQIGFVRHRPLIVASSVAGATLLCAADASAREIVAPAELPVGILCALLGAPVFLHLISKTLRKGL